MKPGETKLQKETLNSQGNIVKGNLVRGNLIRGRRAKTNLTAQAFSFVNETLVGANYLSAVGQR